MLGMNKFGARQRSPNLFIAHSVINLFGISFTDSIQTAVVDIGLLFTYLG